MTHCIACHRPMIHPRPSGMGPVCEKRAAPAPEHERDLFGYSIELGCKAALARIAAHIETMAVEAHIATRREFRQARVRLGVWSK